MSPSSGYVHCKCRDCFEIAIADYNETEAFCTECEEAGCTGEGECQRDFCPESEEDDAG